MRGRRLLVSSLVSGTSIRFGGEKHTSVFASWTVAATSGSAVDQMPVGDEMSAMATRLKVTATRKRRPSRTRSPSFTITSPGRKVVRRSTEHIVLTQSRDGSHREKIQQRFMHWKFMSRITSTRRVR